MVVLQPLSNQSVRQGERVTLECAIPAFPAPEKVQWFRNEVEIFTSPDYTISFSVGLCTLVIAEVFPEDAGTYRCMVTVSGVPNSTTMRLQVAGQYSVTAVATSVRPWLHVKLDCRNLRLLHKSSPTPVSHPPPLSSQP